ncbi:neutral/alkaline non-lysosomal ceramidase N-terminal domain-containing protein [Paenibacillus eucommiae]|uniref:Neutral/alkaline non-lysosomal ceramidase N-terminal domain-containing protein n=1 Tax=Paenibacillus eucommiae TaxID=1355755 RepID=A0ABS4ITB7_9BACL|nr:neutral/alkaline non-lysosomal ceramidase N-terminal domain-containing protein [Paenibacillus eucommiae]MBP1990804.1 hypothetical protein [Paenibacillus eucommiae]
MLNTNSQLQLGTAKVDITPRKSIPLAGFADRSKLGGFTGIAQPIYARILFFRHTDARGHVTASVIISADLIWWGSERIPLLKQQIHAGWGVEHAAILFHATHSHSGPQTSTRFTTLLGEADAEYLEQLEAAVLLGVQEAADQLEVVSAQRSSGGCSIGINRRLPMEQTHQLQPNPHGLVDHELTVIKFLTESQGATKAVLVHYACHPVVHRDNLVSGDFTGAAMESIEAALGGGAMAAFLQGACGDINPGHAQAFYQGKDPLVRELGQLVADEVIKVLSLPMMTLQTCPIAAQSVVVELPLQQMPERSKLEAMVNEPGIMGEWSRKLLSASRPQSAYPLEMSFIQIAEGFSMVAMNAEIVTAYGLLVKSLTAGRTLALGYSNGMFGYVPTAEQLREGGYEPVGSTYYFAMPAPFEPVIERLISEALTDLLGKSFL